MPYTIKNHLLTGTPLTSHILGIKHSGPFAPGLPDTLILHYTAGPSLESALSTFRNPEVKASVHLVIDREGGVVQLAPFNVITWHAGRSEYNGRSNLNRYSLGIEIVNAGKLTLQNGQYMAWFNKAYPEEEVMRATHKFEREPAYWHTYTESQIERVLELGRLLKTEYNIQTLLGHEEIAPTRKTDPGPAFPMDRVQREFYA